MNYASLLIIFIGILIGIPHNAAAINLKPHSIVEERTIKLGDIFEGLERDAERVLGAAPAPGQEMVLNARTLLRIALALDLPWRPESTADYVVLTRAASIVHQDQIKNALFDAMRKDGLDDSFDLLLPNKDWQIVLPANVPATLEIASFRAKPSQNSFHATLVAPSKDNPIERMQISGTLQRVIEVPVIKGTLQNGDIINAHDLDIVRVPEHRITANVILAPEDLYGLTPRRILKSGEMVKDIDVEAPKMVERGEFVTMKFMSGPLALTARGKALQSGAEGDIIRVVNTGSNKTLEGLITASREVTVQTY